MSTSESATASHPSPWPDLPSLQIPTSHQQPGETFQQEEQPPASQWPENLQQLQALQSQLLWELGSRLPDSSPLPQPDLLHLSDLLDQNLGSSVGELRPPKGMDPFSSASPGSLSLPRTVVAANSTPYSQEPATPQSLPPTLEAPSPAHRSPSRTSTSPPEPITTVSQPSPPPEPQRTASERHDPQSPTSRLSPDHSLEFLRLPPTGGPGKTGPTHPAGRGARGGPTGSTHTEDEGEFSLTGREARRRGFEDEQKLQRQGQATEAAVVDQATTMATSTPPIISGSLPATTTTPHVAPGFPSRRLPLPSSPLTPGQTADPRTALLEKHGKHVTDLKKYYESEMAELRRQVQELQLHASTQEQFSALRPAGLSSPVSRPSSRVLRPAGLSSPVSRPSSSATSSELQLENARLRVECSDLQRRLESSNSERYVLDEQVQRLHQAVAEWKQRHLSSERMVAVLQDRLSVTRANLEQQDKTVGQLQDDLQAATDELQLWREQQAQGLEKFDQLLSEFEILQKENRTLQLSCSSLEEELFVCRQEQAELRAISESYAAREDQHKSAISRLEDEVRHLRHVNNRLHNQATHYELGDCRSPLTVNRPDEDKLQHSYASTPPRTPPRAGIGRKLGGSPFRGSTPTPSPAQHLPAPTLTRRKWLEPSDPGLITGAAHIQAPSTTTTPSHHTGTLHPSTPSHQTSTASDMHVEDLETSPIMAAMRESFPGDVGGRDVGSMAESLLQAVRSGRITGGVPERQGPGMVRTAAVAAGGVSERQGPGMVRTAAVAAGGVSERQGPGMVRTAAVAAGGVSERQGPGMVRTAAVAAGGVPERQGPGMSVEERVRLHMRTVATAEQRLADLQAEKDQLESALQRTPRAGGRVTHQAKQKQLVMEGRLEEVLREIGSTRMVLRSHHALRK